MTTPQIALFPPPVRPRFDPDVYAYSQPAKAFTGDFWFTHAAADRLWFAVGDVAGKGLPAALVMAMIQEELEQRIISCSNAGCDPATTMQRLHAFLKPLLPSNRFATAVIGWLAGDGTLRLVNAGHCPPLIVRADGRIERIGSTGPVVGVLPTSRWTAAALALAPGDHLVLYSDGVLEAPSPDGEELGGDGIEHALRARSDGARALAESVLDAVARHTRSTLRADDLTLMVIGR
jgi:sigma-B regulation protein RsbU (phosphoserine phosphatase)